MRDSGLLYKSCLMAMEIAVRLLEREDIPYTHLTTSFHQDLEEMSLQIFIEGLGAWDSVTRSRKAKR